MNLRLPKHGEAGFTLVELLIGILITMIIVGAIGSAMIITLKTSGVANQRMAENHDVLIESAYLANDVQSAAQVNVPGGGGSCTGAFATLVTFAYSMPGNPSAVYQCGTGSNGETQVIRTFSGGPAIVLAHFAGAARPNVDVTYDPAQPSIVVSAAIRFTKANDCTLDCTYTLYGSRRSYNPVNAGGSGSSVPGDTTVLSTGASSPLWVQGSCPDPGTSPSGTAACVLDTSITALPTSDVQTAGWSTTPLWSKLQDQDTTTVVTSAVGSSAEAKVGLSTVSPPVTGANPFVELHAAPIAGTGSMKVTIKLYNGPTLLVTSPDLGPVNKFDEYDWQLTATDTSKIPAAAYSNLTLGFSVSTAKASNGQSVAVDGVALDTAAPAGLLTIKGSLYVNSQLSNAVKLTGTKTATKLTITNGGDFRIWNPGACSGCNHNTVTCTACAWAGNTPWTNYPTSLDDPLRSLQPPDPSTLGTGGCSGSTCSPGVYNSTLSRTSNTTLNPGIYYLKNGMSITGTSTLSCAGACAGGVMIFVAGGGVTLAGNGAINLPAPTSGLYNGVLFFQSDGRPGGPAADTSEFKVAGNAGNGVTNVLGGIVYVPKSVQVTLATGAASLTAKAIVAQNIKVSSAVTIG
jgi:type II secretory pathway pseudopilin PulG